MMQRSFRTDPARRGRAGGPPALLPPLLAPALLLLLAAALWPQAAAAHHILGRPSYSLNEDSNTPSSMQGEVVIGKYTVTYLVFPAFPRPGAPGRVHLYASRTDTGKPFQGEVRFSVREQGWLEWLGIGAGKRSEPMGVQTLDDGVFRQPFTFQREGDYMVTAQFEAEGEPYIIDIPLRVGAPPAFGPIGIAVGVVLALLIGVSLIQRRRAMTGRIREAHERTR